MKLFTPLGLVLTLIFGGIYLAYRSANPSSGRRHYRGKVFTHEELESMMDEMLGKSKKECRKILKKYQNK